MRRSQAKQYRREYRKRSTAALRQIHVDLNEDFEWCRSNNVDPNFIMDKLSIVWSELQRRGEV